MHNPCTAQTGFEIRRKTGCLLRLRTLIGGKTQRAVGLRYVKDILDLEGQSVALI